MKGNSPVGAERRISHLLSEACGPDKLTRALVCTSEGLLVASSEASDVDIPERLAALTSLFADIVSRAGRDLSMRAIDEVTLLDERRGRVVIRPLGAKAHVPMFLVADLPRPASWRRTTTLLVIKVNQILLKSYAAEDG